MKQSHHYITITIFILTICLPVSAQPEGPGIETWSAISGPVSQSVDAAVGFGPDWVALFSNNQIIFQSLGSNETFKPQQLSNIAGWPGDCKVDAAIKWEEGVTLLFCGNTYFYYDTETDSLYDKGSWTNWPSGWSNKIDAAVRWDAARVLFFKGNEYIVYDIYRRSKSEVFRMNDWEDWPSSWNNIQAAVNPGYGVVYFFRNNEYLPYVLDAETFVTGYPRRLR